MQNAVNKNHLKLTKQFPKLARPTAKFKILLNDANESIANFPL